MAACKTLRFKYRLSVQMKQNDIVSVMNCVFELRALVGKDTQQDEATKGGVQVEFVPAEYWHKSSGKERQPVSLKSCLITVAEDGFRIPKDCGSAEAALLDRVAGLLSFDLQSDTTEVAQAGKEYSVRSTSQSLGFTNAEILTIDEHTIEVKVFSTGLAELQKHMQRAGLKGKLPTQQGPDIKGRVTLCRADGWVEKVEAKQDIAASWVPGGLRITYQLARLEQESEQDEDSTPESACPGPRSARR